MVILNRIYTRTGDDGETSLGNGYRVRKTHPRIIAYGMVDELNSALGAVVPTVSDEGWRRRLFIVQNDLFDLGADLCVPEDPTAAADSRLRVTGAQTDRLEGWIDEATAKLTPLTSFVLPGGSPAAIAFHQARTLCRRTEIAVLILADQEHINPQAMIYLNRLSDVLFVWARLANDEGRGDVLWVPGKNRTDDADG